MGVTLLALCLIGTLLVGCSATGQSAGKQSVPTRTDMDPLDLSMDSGFVSIEQTDAYELLMHAETTEIAVKVKENDYIWYSNPQNRDAFDVSTQYQIRLTYLDDTDKEYTMDNQKDSVAFDQYELFRIPGGVRVNYTIGEETKVFLVPKMIEAKRFEEFLSRMEEEDREYLSARYEYITLTDIPSSLQGDLIAQYPAIEEHDLYAIGDLADFLMEALEEIFVRYGYTQDDLNADNMENGVEEAEEAITFKVAVEYTLDEDGLKVSVPWDEIAYSGRVRMTDIELLGLFGAASEEEEGYMLIPDGSGALIHFNNGKVKYPVYDKAVYGEDYALLRSTKDTNDLVISLPVFGVSKQDNAFLATIDSNAENASIQAAVSGQMTAFNQIGAHFNVYINARESIAYNENQVYLFSSEPVEQDITIRYSFLTGDKAGYSGMAEVLRTQLKYAQQLPEPDQMDTSLWINLIGAVDVEKSILGIPVTGMQPLTTYEDAQTIAQLLLDKGVENLDLKLLNWHNGATDSTAPTNVKLLSVLGGKQSFSALSAYCQENQIALYPDVSFLYFRKNSLFDRFSVYRDNAHFISKETAYRFPNYYASTSQRDKRTMLHMIAPTSIGTYVDRYCDAYGKLGIPALSVDTLAVDLYGDYQSSSSITRDEMCAEVVKQLEKLNETGMSIAAQGANMYAFPYVDVITNVPLQSSRYSLFDQDVPFYQMVVHGSIPYYTEPLNYEMDRETAALRLLEYGAFPSYTWIAENNSAIKNTAYDLHSVQYDVWLDEACAVYERTKTALSDLSGHAMLTHEVLAQDVVKVTYEGGMGLLINYTENDYASPEGVVPAKGYLRIKEG